MKKHLSFLVAFAMMFAIGCTSSPADQGENTTEDPNQLIVATYNIDAKSNPM